MHRGLFRPVGEYMRMIVYLILQLLVVWFAFCSGLEAGERRNITKFGPFANIWTSIALSFVGYFL